MNQKKKKVCFDKGYNGLSFFFCSFLILSSLFLKEIF